MPAATAKTRAWNRFSFPDDPNRMTVNLRRQTGRLDLERSTYDGDGLREPFSRNRHQFTHEDLGIEHEPGIDPDREIEAALTAGMRSPYEGPWRW